MTSSVKSISVGYDPINESNIFTSGDVVHGKVLLELSKECKVQSLSIKLKGKAEVQWTENNGNKNKTYYAKEKFFSLKQCLIQEGQGNDIVSQGNHVFPFTFQIPAQELPSSFKGRHGKIVYMLEASLSRSMRMNSKAKAELTVVHRANFSSYPELMAPQSNTVSKKKKASMDVNLERTGFFQGEGIKVVASIQNSSTRDVKIKYILYSKHSFFAKGKRNVETKEILKEVGDTIPPSGGQTVTKIITIPPSIGVSILNCDILKAEYRLKVYLDVKYALDPTLKFPIIILPSFEGAAAELPPPPAYGFEAFSNPSQFGGTSFFQEPAANGPSAPLFTDGSHGVYRSLPHL